MRKLTLLCALLAISLLISCLTPANAFDMARKAVISSQLMFVPRVDSGGFTAQERADLVNDRICSIIGTESIAARNIHLKQVGSCVAIMVGKSLLYTVTPEDAHANNTRSVMALAKRWLKNIQEALPESRPMVS